MALSLGELIAFIDVETSGAELKLSEFQRKLERTGSSVSGKFKDVGSKVSNVGGEVGGVGRDLTKLTAPAGAAALAVGGITAALGWGRLTSVDSAQAQLKGLGYEAGDVERISAQVSSALEGGMMDLGSGTRVAAGALAAGVSEGKELERYIGLVDAAAIGMNTTTDETALIFNRIEGTGKVMRTELDMVEQRMPGFSNAMAEHLGVSSEKFQEMVSDGKVSSDDFKDVMESFAGGMANEYSKSWEGMVSNTKAYVGMIGQSLLGGVFEQSKESIAGLIEWLKDPEVQGRAAELGQSIGSAFSQVVGIVRGVIDWFLQLDGTWQKVILAAAGFAVAIGPVLILLGKIITSVGTMITVAGTVIGWISKLSAVFGAVGKVISLASWALKGLWAVMAANPVGAIIAGITLLVAGLVWFFTKTETGQKIWEKVWGAIKAAAGAVADWFVNNVLPMFVAAWDGIKAAASVVADWVTGTLVPALQSAWQAIASAAQWLYNSVIKPVWNGIKVAIALVVAAVMTYMDLWKAIFQKTVAPLFRWLHKTVIVPVWNAIKAAISAVVNWFKNTAVPFLKAAVDVAKRTFENFKRGLQVIWRFIRNSVINPVFNWFKNTVVAGLSSAVRTIKAKFEQFKLGLRIIWSFIKNTVINPVYSWFKGTVVNGLASAVQTVKAKFEAFKNGLNTIWKNVKNSVINPVYRWFKDTVVGGLKAATDKIKTAFNKMKDSVGKAWDKVKSKAKAPIKFVVDTVINKGIVKNFNKIAGKFGVSKMSEVSVGFASGGVLPGYTPGRDVHSFYSPSLGRLDLSGGEAIMRPEFTRAVGGAAGVKKLNHQAINGQLRTDAFASGGVWNARHSYAGGGALDWLKNKTSDAANWIKDKASWVKDVVSDPLGTFTKFATGLLDNVPAAGVMTDLGKAAVKKAAGWIGNFLKGKGEVGGEGSGYSGPLGSGGSLADASRRARKHGLTMTSGYRPGARTSSGSLSMHGLGRARDYSNSYGPTPQMMAFAREMLRETRPTELLYTPLGSANLHRGGRQYANTGAVKRLHYNHVHVAFKKGGVLDHLGQGYASGTLNATPGWHMVGEQGPELIRFKGGEQVKNTRETIRGTAGGLSEEEMTRFARIVAAEVGTGAREGVTDGMRGSAGRARTTTRMGAV